MNTKKTAKKSAAQLPTSLSKNDVVESMLTTPKPTKIVQQVHKGCGGGITYCIRYYNNGHMDVVLACNVCRTTWELVNPFMGKIPMEKCDDMEDCIEGAKIE